MVRVAAMTIPIPRVVTVVGRPNRSIVYTPLMRPRAEPTMDRLDAAVVALDLK
jgi:hypothetical protein